MATIADIAKSAGVSTSTVSHVINRTRWVNPETAAAVQSVIDELGYRPNQLARSLARASSGCVGLACSTISNPFFGDLVGALLRECARVGLMVFLSDTEDAPKRELEVIVALHERRVDGVILAPAPDPGRKTLDYLAEQKVPCVLVDRLLDTRFDGVGVENRQGVAELVDHLVSHGHSRIGYVAGHPRFDTTLERLEGYREALRRSGIRFDSKLVAPSTGDTASASTAALALLRSAKPPTALIGGNNIATIGAIRAARLLGLSVPSKLAIVGFDDFDWAEDFEPRLSVLAQPIEQICRLAVQRLRERIRDPASPTRHDRIPGTLIVRQSCGCVRGESSNG